MDYTSASGSAAEELARLLESGAISEGVTLERSGDPRTPALVRPVVDGSLDDWMPGIERSIGAVNGVVAFSGPDIAETAELAAGAAAWLGDRGRTVVLVDASVERPALGKALPEDGDEGLVDAVLYGVSPPAVVRRTLSPGVSVVTAGSHPLSVGSVFDDSALPRVLRALADDALVLIILPPANLPAVSGVLDAALLVAGSVPDIESLASCAEGVRTAGILVRDRVDENVAEDTPAEPDAPPAIVLPTHEEQEEPAYAETEEQETVPVNPARADVESDSEPVERPEQHLEPIVIGSPPRTRARHDHLASTVAVVVVLVIATVIWWNVDGRRRFYSEQDDRAGTAVEQLTEGTASAPGSREDPGPAEAGEGTSRPDGTDEEQPVTDAELTADDGQGTAAVVGEPVGEPGEDTAVPPGGERPAGDEAIVGPGGSYRIMVSSHHREASAEVEAVELGRAGVVAEVMAAEIEGRGVWYRVVVSGGYPTLASARSVLDTIKTFGYEGAWIERVPESQQ